EVEVRGDLVGPVHRERELLLVVVECAERDAEAPRQRRRRLGGRYADDTEAAPYAVGETGEEHGGGVARAETDAQPSRHPLARSPTIGAGAPFASGSSNTPRCSSPRQISCRISVECSPIPPVKTRLSIPPRTAARAPTSRRARWQNIAMARAAFGSRSRASRS